MSPSGTRRRGLRDAGRLAPLSIPLRLSEGSGPQAEMPNSLARAILSRSDDTRGVDSFALIRITF